MVNPGNFVLGVYYSDFKSPVEIDIRDTQSQSVNCDVMSLKPQRIGWLYICLTCERCNKSLINKWPTCVVAIFIVPLRKKPNIMQHQEKNSAEGSSGDVAAELCFISKVGHQCLVLLHHLPVVVLWVSDGRGELPDIKFIDIIILFLVIDVAVQFFQLCSYTMEDFFCYYC